MDVVAGARNKVSAYALRAAASIDEKLVSQEEKNDQYVSQMFDQVKIASVKKVLQMMGPVTNEMAKPAYAPKRLCNFLDYVHAGIWPELEAQLEDMILSSVTASGRRLKQRQLRGWAKAPQLWRPGEYSQRGWRCIPPKLGLYVRAKILYALFPADANKFRHLTDPLAMAILFLKVCPVFGINVLAFILLFLLIDRTDESQLVRYILSFKTFQFITGLMAYTKLGFSLVSCLESVGDATDTALAELAGEGLTCRDYAPGDYPSFKFVMALELVRGLLLIAAGVALAGGVAYGGMEELIALEHVRWKVFEGDEAPTGGGVDLLPSPFLHEYLLAQVTPTRAAPDGVAPASSEHHPNPSNPTKPSDLPSAFMSSTKELLSRITPTKPDPASGSGGYARLDEELGHGSTGSVTPPPVAAPPASPSPEMGTLHVHLVSATGLKSADRNGKSDPYARLRLAGQQLRSKTVMETLEPRWDEHFEFVGARDELLGHTLHVHVFDRDRLAMDDKLGAAQVGLEPLLHAPAQGLAYEEVPLSEQGSVHLHLRWATQARDEGSSSAGDARGGRGAPAAPQHRSERSRDTIPVLCERRLVTGAEFKASIAAARLKYGVERRNGGFLPYFMVYDVVVVVVLLLYLLIKTLHLRSQGAPEWLLWMSCFKVKTVWALLGLPYMAFAIPVLGESLHRAKTTAYDQAGLLVPALKGAEMKQRIALEQEEARAHQLAAEARREEASDLTGAALRIQRIRRGNKARKRTGARLMRHLVVQTPVGFFVSASEIEKWFH